MNTQPAIAQESQASDVPGGRWMTPEAFAALDSLEVRLVRSMLAPSGRTVNTFDERDVRRYSKRDIRLYVTRVNTAGVRCPRIVPRASKPKRAPARKVNP